MVIMKFDIRLNKEMRGDVFQLEVFIFLAEISNVQCDKLGLIKKAEIFNR